MFGILEERPCFNNEKEIQDELRMSEDQFNKDKSFDGNFSDYYWFKKYLSDRAKAMGNHYCDIVSYLSGIPALALLFLAFKLFPSVEIDHETMTYYLCEIGNCTAIKEKDLDLCRLYSFLCSGTMWLTLIGLAVYFVATCCKPMVEEKKAFHVSFTLLFVVLSSNLICLWYILFNGGVGTSFMHYQIRHYFGLLNLWYLILSIILSSTLIISHRYACRYRYMESVSKRIIEYYDKIEYKRKTGGKEEKKNP